MSDVNLISKKFFIFRELDQNLVQKIKLFYINRCNVLFVTIDDDVYHYYSQDNVKQLKQINELKAKSVIKFDISFNHYSYLYVLNHFIAITSKGELFTWGCNKFGQLGIGTNEDTVYPVKNTFLEHTYVTDACCGEWHTVVLTSDGEVYSFGKNNSGEIGNNNGENQFFPVKIMFNFNEKVKEISCGLWHTIAITETGVAAVWGNNNSGQLGLSGLGKQLNPKVVNNIAKVKTAVCGPRFTVIITFDNDIYFSGHIATKLLSYKIFTKINKTKKFEKIAATVYSNFCVAITDINKCYVLGKYREEVINDFLEVESTSVNEVFASCLQITYKTLTVDYFIKNLCDKEKNIFFKQKLESFLKPDKFKKEFNQISSLGGGSFGNVFKCYHIQNKEYYAVKKISLNYEDYEKICREVDNSEKISQIDNKYVVKYYDSWFETNYYLGSFDTLNSSHVDASQKNLFNPDKPLLLHIQMELCSITLRDAITILIYECFKTRNKKQVIGYFISSQLFIEILECVNYLHRQSFIHRDLYPANILLTNFINNRFIKIGDFGLSKFHNPEKSLTKGVGNIEYRAHEVNTGIYTTKADVYSLGIIAQQLFYFDFLCIDDCLPAILTTKIKMLSSLINSLVHSDENVRPSCDQILDDCNMWSLNKEEILNDNEFNLIFNKMPKASSIEENFIEFFIQNKPKSINIETTKTEDIIENYRFKNYFIELSPLGTGAFSTVFKAKHIDSNELYAIKKISFNQEHRESVMKELEFLSKFSSNYVVKYISSWCEENYYIGSFANQESQNLSFTGSLFNPYQSLLVHIQMELCPLTMRDAIIKIANECTETDNTLSIVGYYISSELLYEILECVEYLHSQNPAIIHRDLKPENILLTNFVNNRFVKLSDFGLSTFHEFADQSHTKYKGTRGYKAPELNFTTKYSTKADIFSLGIIIQEMFHIQLNNTDETVSRLLPLKEIKKLALLLLNGNPNLRPNSDKILSAHKKWRLSHNQCSINEDIVRIVNKESKPTSIDENFIEFFIQNKFKSNSNAYYNNRSFIYKVFNNVIK